MIGIDKKYTGSNNKNFSVGKILRNGRIINPNSTDNPNCGVMYRNNDKLLSLSSMMMRCDDVDNFNDCDPNQIPIPDITPNIT
mmetsp:Transcript_23483/g.26320  ORF Transcript_23483/g.26320 Transcript_23483/m.26320 type:complete len:83 (-) Transcript_23483:457-705(-)